MRVYRVENAEQYGMYTAPVIIPWGNCRERNPCTFDDPGIQSHRSRIAHWKYRHGFHTVEAMLAWMHDDVSHICTMRDWIKSNNGTMHIAVYEVDEADVAIGQCQTLFRTDAACKVAVLEWDEYINMAEAILAEREEVKTQHAA